MSICGQSALTMLVLDYRLPSPCIRVSAKITQTTQTTLYEFGAWWFSVRVHGRECMLELGWSELDHCGRLRAFPRIVLHTLWPNKIKSERI